MAKKQKKVSVVVDEPLSEDITSMDGSIILCRKGTMVTRELIDKLSAWIVEEEPRLTDGIKKKPRKVKKAFRDEIIKKLEFDEIVSQKTKEELDKGCTEFFERIGSRAEDKNFGSIEQTISEMVEGTSDNPDVPLKLSQMKKHASYVYLHSVECSVIASFIATNLNYPAHEITAFSTAMLLHDTGLLMVPEEYLKIGGKLSEKEVSTIRNHPQQGWDALKQVPGIDPLALLVAIGHHVYADGTGYPSDIRIDSLPPLVHLATLIDHFEAMTADRPYRRSFHMHEAVKMIMAQRHMYHPGAFENFISVVGIYPISTLLMLNSGEVGVVVRSNPENLFLPEVKLVLDRNGKVYSKEIVVNLLDEPDRMAVGVVDDI